MILTVTSDKTVATLREDLPRAAAAHAFGVLGVHDLSAKMKEKGLDFAGEVLIFEVCNPHQAKSALEAAPEVSSFLPCRISVHRTAEGATRLSTIRPTALMEGFGVTALSKIAAEVEATLVAIMNDAR
ncbi:MAG: DUF302 domain-containing protein [Polyangiaceae bacterium]|nr:DUF302 domain-containing protein [Polyangiaceae bacterium]